MVGFWSSHRKAAFARYLFCFLSVSHLKVASSARTPWFTSSQQPLPAEERLFHVTPENYASVAAVLASPQREIILTALSFTHKGQAHEQEQLDFVKNFALHLHRLGRLENTMILSYDNQTCNAMQQHAGILCFVDQAAPPVESLPGGSNLQQSALSFLLHFPACSHVAEHSWLSPSVSVSICSLLSE